MSKFDVKNFELSVGTTEEYDEVLKRYKEQNPEKYAAKLAKGEFDKFKEKLVGQPKVEPEVKLEVEPEKPKVASPTKPAKRK